MVQGEDSYGRFLHRLRPLACRKGQQPEDSFPDQHRLGLKKSSQPAERRRRLDEARCLQDERGQPLLRAGRRTLEGRGRVVADAVMVVAGTQAAPQAGNDGASSDGGAPAACTAFSVGGETIMDGKAVDSEVIERARTHLGTPYVHSPPMPCTAYLSEDCSCFTSLVFSEWVTMPDNPVGQWYMGESVEKSDLLPGDLVFFKEAGPYRPITHVGIYSGPRQHPPRLDVLGPGRRESDECRGWILRSAKADVERFAL